MTHPFDKAREAACKSMSVASRLHGTYQAMLTAALTALEAHGWKLVPVEPTEEMVECALVDAINFRRELGVDNIQPDGTNRLGALSVRRCYAALLAAAPKREG